MAKPIKKRISQGQEKLKRKINPNKNIVSLRIFS